MARKQQQNTKGHPTTWADEKALKKYYKQLSTPEVEAWVAELGLTFTPSDSEPIHRMRACMAVLYHYFPREVKPKKESKYKKYSLEELLTMCIDKDVPVEPTDDERIMRMRAIMALRAHKVID